MSSLIRAVELLPEEVQMLGENVAHAIESDGAPELAAVNRSLAVHGESVDDFVCPASGDQAA